ncbi:nucleotidyltransferase domain-containing protein [Alkaliphilus peptidifermentans]|uniref:Uncharacterized nucleotidyltransferase n=1 Tax=Alkaliphilus peptidifermentans DSM 18978 TaxID=1120976 RepID=A0A1G5L9B5_9FIRM|nr:nucleotidyltransferase family protein [Alkaliphilus peptidifermentans]SCZ09497.1 Uncharacterised nucleotidyltransferase [Alkaliphilus peptidifermentans DSM 18978]
MTHKELTNEQYLILLVSRLTYSDNDEDELKRIVREKLDWDSILLMAKKHKIMPLLWYNLTTKGLKEAIPYQLERLFKFYYLGTVERNKIYLEELSKIREAFKANGLVCSPLKGGYLIENMYKDLGIRTINDIDIMIESVNRLKVIEVMRSIGYEQGDYDYINHIIKPINREKQIFWKMNMNNLYPFKKLHNSEYCKMTEIDFSFSLDFDLNSDPITMMLQRKIEDNSDDITAVLKPEDFFIHLCCHLYKEATNVMWVKLESDLNLIKFCDVREFALQKMEDKSLERAIEFAKNYKMEEAIYYTLYYLRKLYNDGYETNVISKMDISHKVLDSFGENDYGTSHKWNKTFLQRLFALNNLDELSKEPNYMKVKDSDNKVNM